MSLPIRSQTLHALVSRLLGLAPLARFYDQWLEWTDAWQINRSGSRLLDYALNRLDAKLDWLHEENLLRVPSDGPVIFVANHPVGGLDGMLLAQALLRLRSDLRVLTNELLLRFPEFQELFIGVNVLNSKATRLNVRGLRTACRHLAAGSALLVFPAGTVARYRINRGQTMDAAWHPLVGRLASRFRAFCVPIRIEGRNSASFHLAGLLHKRLQTALLPRQLANKRGCTLRASAGQPISPSEVQRLNGPDSITSYLRLSSELLATSASAAVRRRRRPLSRVVCSPAPDQLQDQLEKLKQFRLVDDLDAAVYCAPFEELGCLMRQIAIEREKSFRTVDEGTGRGFDQDRFDTYYRHLFAWDKRANAVIGAYRVGLTDEILSLHGLKGLYSRSLYRYSRAFIDSLGMALEVGRSFVAVPYQRHPKSLDLLWRGIGTFLLLHPQYHTLFGCVSISSQYSELARAFLADTLINAFAIQEKWLRQVHPRAPIRVSGKCWTPEVLRGLNDVALVNKLLGNIDAGRRIPVLLRHYLALNGRFVSFTVNRGFNDSLDGLIVVDLRDAPQKYLKRYMGDEGSVMFMNRWKHDAQAA